MKHYEEIENIRYDDVDLGNGIVRKSNIGCFEVGDHVVIQEKFDGSCASFKYEGGELIAYSRKHELNYKTTMNGFYNWVKALDADLFKDTEGLLFFGEWTDKNKIVYNADYLNAKKLLVFDIYDLNRGIYLYQSDVEEMCKKKNLEYIHTLYDGDFVSWEHARSFMDSPNYGEVQEGIIIKNQSKLHDDDTNRFPIYLKIVNQSFIETRSVKIIDPAKEEERKRSVELISTVVTKNRVEKILIKLVNEGILPKELTPKDMGTVAKTLPKRVYKDIEKEEPEILQSAGEYGGKAISTQTMVIARSLLLGQQY